MRADTLPRIDGVLLRQLPVAALAQRGRKRLARSFDDVLLALADVYLEAGEVSQEQVDGLLTMNAASLALTDPKPRGSRDLGDEHYRKVAEVYAKALREGRPPTKAVQERFQIEKSSAAKQVARARERGFLPKGPGRGRTGGLGGTA
ncbi:MAG: hypothetical protein JWL79_3079 [Frankiales bacterium]|nr:hypothetical protein [Frankiales bacterium]